MEQLLRAGHHEIPPKEQNMVLDLKQIPSTVRGQAIMIKVKKK